MSSNILNLIVKGIIPLLGAVITYMIVPFIIEKTSEKTRDNIKFWVRIGVYAAEQMEDAGIINMPKKEYVITFIHSKGFDISEEDLEIMIEAAVRELNIEQMKCSTS